MKAWLVVTSLLVVTSAFNIDTKNAVVHTMPSMGYFGYSLDFYNEEKGMPVLVVGAPESETTNPNLRGIRRPGAVFVCSVNKPTCREVHIDKKRTFRPIWLSSDSCGHVPLQFPKKSLSTRQMGIDYFRGLMSHNARLIRAAGSRLRRKAMAKLIRYGSKHHCHMAASGKGRRRLDLSPSLRPHYKLRLLACPWWMGGVRATMVMGRKVSA
ncbi:unnamed protein product [Heligmosomoides polygyrus]|uniref:COesterase domain-containing protein n=1 Tax=Heligmosomoides polygyrus TaxID=6339 RepID=A0A183GDF0_HELPZ|nr:unnamed protein product [Heligmosomoides polygyrus]